jgi:excisionase family DNA binding protein
VFLLPSSVSLVSPHFPGETPSLFPLYLGDPGLTIMSDRQNNQQPTVFNLEPLIEVLADRLARKLNTLPSLSCARTGPRLLNLVDAARHLGRTKASVQHLVANGSLPTVRSGRRVFLDIMDLDQWIEQNKHDRI